MKIGESNFKRNNRNKTGVNFGNMPAESRGLFVRYLEFFAADEGVGGSSLSAAAAAVVGIVLLIIILSTAINWWCGGRVRKEANSPAAEQIAQLRAREQELLRRIDELQRREQPQKKEE